MFAPKYKSYFV